MGTCIKIKDKILLFFDSHERETNILNELWNKTKIENDCLFHDLVGKMLSGKPENRPSLDKVLVHPYFWATEEKLHLICDLSDFLEANGYLLLINHF